MWIGDDVNRLILLALCFALTFCGCAAPATRYPQPASPAVKPDRAATMAASPVAKLWLFLHPDSAWLAAGCPREGEAAAVTGVILIALPCQDQRMPGAIARIRAAGLEVVAGRWHSQQPGVREALFSREWQAAQRDIALSLAAQADGVAIDTEPYLDAAHWYPPHDFGPALRAAAAPWSALGGRSLLILPGDLLIETTAAIAEAACAGGSDVTLADEWPYYAWCTPELEAQRRAATEAAGYRYMGGYLLSALHDRTYRPRIAAHDSWLWPNDGSITGFGSVDWRPPPVRDVAGDCNCDGVLDFADINPFLLAMSNPLGYAAEWPRCPGARADVNRDGTVDAADAQWLVTLLSEAAR